MKVKCYYKRDKIGLTTYFPSTYMTKEEMTIWLSKPADLQAKWKVTKLDKPKIEEYSSIGGLSKYL